MIPSLRPIVLLLIVSARAAGAQPATSLVQMRNGVYMLQDGNETAVVFVAPEAILVADPPNVAAATWLHGELSARFPERPVRHVVYTTHTPDRAIAGIAFPGAAVHGHAKFNEALSDTTKALGSTKSLPAAFADLDANRNELLESAEWSKNPRGRYMAVADRNRDGTLTPAEAVRLVARANRTFRDDTTITVGSTTVQVVNPAGSFATPALYFSQERILYVGSHPAFGREGFSLAGTTLRDMVEWLHGIAALPFDTLITGRSGLLTRDSFAGLVRYAEDLQAATIDAYTRGWTVDRTAAAPSLQKYAGTAVDAQRRTNIVAIFDSLRVTRVEVQGTGFARWMSPDKNYCAGYEACLSGGRIAGGGGGLRVTWSSIGIVLETAFDDQFLTTREGFFDDQVYQQRNARGSILFRLGKTRPSSVSIDLLAGATLIVADTEGIERIKQAVAPFGGRHAINERTRTWGATVGMDLVLPVSRAISVFLPIRATGVPRRPEHSAGPVDVSGGIGLSIRLSQTVR